MRERERAKATARRHVGRRAVACSSALELDLLDPAVELVRLLALLELEDDRHRAGLLDDLLDLAEPDLLLRRGAGLAAVAGARVVGVERPAGVARLREHAL